MSSWQNTATASESLHVPVGAAAATTEPAPTRALRVRVVGATAIASAALVLIDNTVVGWAGSPTYAAPIKEVLAFHAHHSAGGAISVGLEALNVPLLLLFLTGLHGLVGRRGGAGADWSRLAVAAGSTLAAGFALYVVLWDGVVFSPRGVAGPSPLFQLVWQLHAGAFALALSALGATFIGAALAAHASRLAGPGQRGPGGGRGGLAAPWQRVLGGAGGGLLIAAGVANLAIADGSPILFVGLLGYAAWLVWLLVTGVRLVLVRREGGAASAPVPPRG